MRCLSSFMSASKGHSAHLALDPCKRHHRDVHDEKQYESYEPEEVNGPCRLRSAEEVEESRIGRGDRWRHRKSREQHKRQRDQNDNGVTELLQRTVGWPAARSRHWQVKMCRDVLPQSSRRKLARVRDQVPPQ